MRFVSDHSAPKRDFSRESMSRGKGEEAKPTKVRIIAKPLPAATNERQDRRRHGDPRDRRRRIWRGDK
jgi:hypothetical protein